MPDLEHIFRQFSTNCRFLSAGTFGSGHIHNTYLVRTGETKCKDYILQKINNAVFKDVEAVQSNILKVTSHIKNKLGNLPDANADRETLQLIQTNDKKPFYKNADNEYWRLFEFINNTYTYDKPESSRQAYECGKAFGKFQQLLSDMDGKTLKVTIPDFHNLEKRLADFYSLVKQDRLKLAKGLIPEIETVDKFKNEMLDLQMLAMQNKLPLRITHNDTKLNNVLFDESGKAICVVDLDTVMPGYIYSDFGDSIRTITNAAEEDEKDLSKVKFILEYYISYSKGFLENTRSVLTALELEKLHLSGMFMTYMQGLRFLSDYIDGNRYYKTEYPEHNLVRSRNQFRLLEEMSGHSEQMISIIRELL